MLRKAKTIPPNNFLIKAVEKHYWSLRNFYFFCVFWLLIASLALVQDYIKAILNDSNFILFDSIIYKSFWLLFIPFSWISLMSWQAIGRIKWPFNFIVGGISTVFISLLHLVVFALLLTFVTNLVYENLHDLSFFIKQKLSTRLYLAISGHILILFIHSWFGKRAQSHTNKKPRYDTILPVKTGKKSAIVNISSINYVKSDGVYIAIYTNEKKYVMVNSLKNIIKKLNPDQFKRIHRSTIVNLEAINELRSRQNGDYDVVLKDKTLLRLSRNYTKYVKKKLF